MSLEAIRNIQAAEEQAKREKADAQAAAQRAVAAAEKAAEEAMKAALQRAETELAALMKATEAKAEENAGELSQNTANKCAAIRAHAEKNLDAAAQYIVRRVVDS